MDMGTKVSLVDYSSSSSEMSTETVSVTDIVSAAIREKQIADWTAQAGDVALPPDTPTPRPKLRDSPESPPPLEISLQEKVDLTCHEVLSSESESDGMDSEDSGSSLGSSLSSLSDTDDDEDDDEEDGRVGGHRAKFKGATVFYQGWSLPWLRRVLKYLAWANFTPLDGELAIAMDRLESGRLPDANMMTLIDFIGPVIGSPFNSLGWLFRDVWTPCTYYYGCDCGHIFTKYRKNFRATVSTKEGPGAEPSVCSACKGIGKCIGLLPHNPTVFKSVRELGRMEELMGYTLWGAIDDRSVWKIQESSRDVANARVYIYTKPPDCTPKPIKVVFLMGMAGAGKGTFGDLVSASSGGKVVALTAGGLLRSAAAANSIRGKRIKAYMDKSSFVPSAYTCDLIVEELYKIVFFRTSKDDVPDWVIVDGFPRTDGNIIGWDNIKPWFTDSHSAILMRCSPEIAKERCFARGRPDDSPEVLARRCTEAAQAEEETTHRKALQLCTNKSVLEIDTAVLQPADYVGWWTAFAAQFE